MAPSKWWLLLYLLEFTLSFRFLQPIQNLRAFRVFDTKTDAVFLKPSRIARGVVVLPGSKSISNRALLLASLCEGITTIENILESEDIAVMCEALKSLGVEIHHDKHLQKCLIKGNHPDMIFSNLHSSPLKLHLGNAGTVMRPLTAMLSFGKGKFFLDGVKRMRERPIGDLVEALRHLGCGVSCIQGYPPITIDTQGACNTQVDISGNISSQFLSSLLMAAPLAKNEITIRLNSPLNSAPYIQLTIQIMKSFGVTVHQPTPTKYFIPQGQTYTSSIFSGKFLVEGDASSASYFLAAGAIAAGPVTVQGCGSGSIQGDVQFASILNEMGSVVKWSHDNITTSCTARLRGLDVDCVNIPDAAMTLAVVAVFAHGKTRLRNIGSWRLKECDRIQAMATELRKFGVMVEEGDDFLVIEPPLKGPDGMPILNRNVTVETYDDHRIAMAFSLVSLARTGVTINGCSAVNKTFPLFFRELERITGHGLSQ